MSKWTPAAVGVAGIAVSTIAADVWAVQTKRPTVSSAIATALDHQIAGPVAIGVIGALGWHLVVDPIIRKLVRSIDYE